MVKQKNKFGVGLVIGLLIGATVVLAASYGGEFFSGNLMKFKRTTAPANTIDLAKNTNVQSVIEESLRPEINIDKDIITALDTCNNDEQLFYYRNTGGTSSIPQTYATFIDLYNGLNPDNYGNVDCPVEFHTFVNSGSNMIDVTCNRIQKHYDNDPETYTISCYDDNNQYLIQRLQYHVATDTLESYMDFPATIRDGDHAKIHTESDDTLLLQVFEKSN